MWLILVKGSQRQLHLCHSPAKTFPTIIFAYKSPKQINNTLAPHLCKVGVPQQVVHFFTNENICFAVFEIMRVEMPK